MQFPQLYSSSVHLMIVLLSVLSSLTVTYPELFWADQYIHQTHEVALMAGVDWVNFLNMCLQMFKKRTPWSCLLLDFAFSKLSKLKDAGSSTEGITWSSVNYLHHLMNESRFVKKSRKDNIFIFTSWMKTLSQSLLLLWHLFVSLFFSSVCICLLRNLEIITCIVKSLIAIQHIFVEV